MSRHRSARYTRGFVEDLSAPTTKHAEHGLEYREMTHLDSIIQRCLSREADSFTDLVEATYDEATRRVSRTPGKLVAVYQLIHRHIDQIKKGRDFWPWFDSLTLSVPEEGTQAQKSDILRVCGSVPKARSQYSL